MPTPTRAAYERGMADWLPHILYGVHAVEAEKQADAASLDDLPRGEIVRAF